MGEGASRGANPQPAYINFQDRDSGEASHRRWMLRTAFFQSSSRSPRGYHGEHTVELAADEPWTIARPPGISGEPPTFNDTNVAKDAILQMTGNWTTVRPVGRALAICGLGVAFGAATSLSNWLASQFDSDSIARIPSLILDAGWTWAALGVLAGWLAAAPRSSTAASRSTRPARRDLAKSSSRSRRSRFMKPSSEAS